MTGEAAGFLHLGLQIGCPRSRTGRKSRKNGRWPQSYHEKIPSKLEVVKAIIMGDKLEIDSSPVVNSITKVNTTD